MILFLNFQIVNTTLHTTLFSYRIALLLLAFTVVIKTSAQDLWDPDKGPIYSDVTQRKGSLGCWLGASMASVAYADQSRLENVLKDNHDGTVTVTLYHGSRSSTYTIPKALNDGRSIDSSPLRPCNLMQAYQAETQV